MASAVQQFVMKPDLMSFWACDPTLVGVVSRRRQQPGKGLVQPAEDMPDTMDGRQYRSPGIRGAKHQVGPETGLLVEEKKHE